MTEDPKNPRGSGKEPSEPGPESGRDDDAGMDLLLGRDLRAKLRAAGVALPAAGAAGKAAGSAPAPVKDAGQAPPAKPAKRLNLDDMVGQAAAKQALNQVIAIARMNAVRKERALAPLELTLHAVFAGSPGTGKTTFARFYAQEVAGLGLLSKGHLVEVARQDLIAEYQGQTATKTAAVVQRALGGILFIDEAYALKQGKDDTYGQEAIDTLVKCMEDHRDDLILILAGYTEEMRQFLHHNTGIKSRIPNLITFEDYTPEELRQILHGMAKKQGFTLEAPAAALAMEEIGRARRGRSFGNAREVRNVFERAQAQQSVRLARRDPAALTNADLTTLILADFTPDPHDDGREVAPAAAKATAREELERLPGLAAVKSELLRLTDFARVARHRGGGAPSAMHLIFRGNRGSGRSTVAALAGRLLHEAGLLASGHLVTAGRASLVAEYQGQTATRTRGVVESALGGVLLIREPESLLRDSYGAEALETLIPALETHRSALMAILCGSPAGIDQLVASRPDLTAAVAGVIEFPDYEPEELRAIAHLICARHGFDLAPDALPALARLLAEARTGSDYANARTVERLIDAAGRRQAERLLKQGDPAALDPAALRRLIGADFT